MKRNSSSDRSGTIRVALFCVVTGCVMALTPGPLVRAADVAQPEATASLDLLRRAVDPNPTLQSYIAAASLSAGLRTIVPIHETFKGTVYYLKPTRKIIFENVPGPLSRFRDLTSTTPTYDQALAEYSIAPLADDGAMSTYSLTPKMQGGRVTNLTVIVNDTSALIEHAVWSYNDGGSLKFDLTYQTIGIFRVPAKDTIAARFPGYDVDGVITFSDYQPNAAVDPSVFTKT